MNRVYVVGLFALIIGLVMGFMANEFWKLQADENSAKLESEIQLIQEDLDDIDRILSGAESEQPIQENTYAGQ